jgi:hypothetical protein
MTHYARKTYRGVKVQFHHSIRHQQVDVSGQFNSRSAAAFIHNRRGPGTHRIRGWVGPAASQRCGEDTDL